jgi:Ca2+-binding RTX toxin-like protein
MRFSKTTRVDAAVAIDSDTVADPAMLATMANFANGTLSLFGDALDNTLTVGRDAAGLLVVNGGTVPVGGGMPTVDNTTLIQVFGQGGDDSITLDDANGPMPRGQLFGGTGNDMLHGGSAGDQLFGQIGDDRLFGHGGLDFLFGGTDNDLLVGGAGDDQMYGEAGNDRLVWNDGDGNDLFEGGAGIDTAEVNGGAAGEHFALTANGDRVRIDRLDPAAPAFIDAGTTETVVFNLGGGADKFSAAGNLAALVQLTVDGGAGNDEILGGNGTDVLIGGEGDDTVDGNQGNDSVYLGPGNDRFVWSPGDGSDVVEGGAGSDAMAIDGSNIGEQFELSASGAWLLLTRDIANISQLAGEVETVALRTFGGADRVTVNDLAATAVREVLVDFGPNPGQPADGVADVVVVHGSVAADQVSVSFADDRTSVTGLAATVTLHHAEAGFDRVQVSLGAGDDTLNGGGLAGAAAALVADGGQGEDMLGGGANADELHGGEGDDLLRGADGRDLLHGGANADRLLGDGGDDLVHGDAGDDRLVWNLGDGNDVFEGGEGVDTAEVNGGDDADQVTLTANLDRVRIDRIDVVDPAFIDAGTIERLVVNLGGGNDRFSATGNVGALVQLSVDGGAGNDEILGGNGTDVLIGGEGDDTVDGNQGNDSVYLGHGNDRFVWSPGDGSDVVEGGAGSDTMAIDGSNIGEQFELSASGSWLLFTRDIANISHLAEEVEAVELRSFGGADRVTVNDLAATAVREVLVDFGPNPGQPADGVADVVAVSGTAAADQVNFTFTNGLTSVLGMAAVVRVRGAEAGLDRVQVNLGVGDDLLTGAGLAAGAPKLVVDGGEGQDLLTGSGNNDELHGGADNDRLIGSGGDDLMDGGEGDDRLVWTVGDGNDLFEGGGGTDSAEVTGSGAAEHFTLTANGDRIRIDRLDTTSPSFIDAGTVEKLVISLGGGNDRFSATGNVGPLVQLTVDGGADDDAINGGNGADMLIGGDGNDSIDGNQGNDSIHLGAGNDRFSWGPGDGSDVVEGGTGTDTMAVDGSNIGEQFELSAAGGRLRFTRDIANITLDGDDVEKVELRTLGGSDRITVNDLRGTDVKMLSIDLAGSAGGGDGQADTVVINGSAGRDVVTISVDASGAVVVRGLATEVVIRHFEADLDRLEFNGLGGNDVVFAGAPPAVMLPLILRGGDGNDILTGGAGADTLDGGAGFDILVGGPGADVLVNGELQIQGLPTFPIDLGF